MSSVEFKIIYDIEFIESGTPANSIFLYSTSGIYVPVINSEHSSNRNPSEEENDSDNNEEDKNSED